MTTVLFLEDDDDLREYLQAHLEAYGFRVVARGNSEGIVHLVKNSQADILLTDLMMPQHEGLEGIFLVRQIPGLKIIAVSSSAAFLQLAENLVDCCLRKPISADDLILAIERVMAAEPRIA